VYPYRQVTLVLGVSEDKDVAAICAHLKDNAVKIILTCADHPRAHMFNEQEVAQYFEGKAGVIEPDLKQALQHVLKTAKKDDVVLVTGSVFVVAQAMEHLCTNTKV
jgi:dihydrofolate synthase/folylpolyglutamate synthase